MYRFINADSVDVLDEDQNNVLENNLFAYCLNNPVNMVDYDGNSAVAIAGGYGLYVWAFAGANAWNIIGQVVLVGMAVVTIVLAIKIVYDKTSGKKTTKNGSETFAKNLDHHKIIAIINPKKVPRQKPTAVSYTVTLICVSKLLEVKFKKVFKILVG